MYDFAQGFNAPLLGQRQYNTRSGRRGKSKGQQMPAYFYSCPSCDWSLASDDDNMQIISDEPMAPYIVDIRCPKCKSASGEFVTITEG
eukprot:g44786.t1